MAWAGLRWLSGLVRDFACSVLLHRLYHRYQYHSRDAVYTVEGPRRVVCLHDPSYPLVGSTTGRGLSIRGRHFLVLGRLGKRMQQNSLPFYHGIDNLAGFQRASEELMDLQALYV